MYLFSLIIVNDLKNGHGDLALICVFLNYSGTSVAKYCNIHHIKGIYFLYPMT